MLWVSPFYYTINKQNPSWELCRAHKKTQTRYDAEQDLGEKVSSIQEHDAADADLLAPSA